MTDGVKLDDVEQSRELAVVEAGGSKWGKIEIHDNVVTIIARQTAKSVAGVVELTGSSLVGGIASMIGKKKELRVRVGKEDQEVRSIDLEVMLEYGVSIPETCEKLQLAVKNAVEEMTGNRIFAVNVSVLGVRCPDSSVEED
jgi:uncharacterized alkaline shock family protein YloU